MTAPLVAALDLVQGDRRDVLLAAASLCLLVAGTSLAAVAVSGRQRLELVATGVACAGVTAWLLSNRPLEGPVLLTVLPGNGLTVGDLLAVPSGLLVAVLARRHQVRGSTGSSSR